MMFLELKVLRYELGKAQCEGEKEGMGEVP
jgi:hypothetical protein